MNPAEGRRGAPDSAEETSFALAYRIVDAFTARPFSGNPAAVILPGSESDALTDSQRRQVAAEMNLSETAFPSTPDSDDCRRLRWFTPTTEVSLCGHATLATAHILLEEGAHPPLRFQSLSGPLVVSLDEDGLLRLDFPADPPHRREAPDGLLEALGVDPATPFLTGSRCALIVVDDEETLQGLAPDATALGRVRLPEGVMGVSVTARAAEDGVDFASRFFGPWVGVPEDPVTGMAHTTLGPYWAMQLGREQLEARQRSSRGGAVGVRIMGDRVHLLGRAVTVARGELIPPP